MPLMFTVTSLVPAAACCTFCAISRVAAPCSSTLAAIALEVLLMSPMIVPMPLMAATASFVADWIWPICWLISSVALAVWLARFLTSAATTAKPFPVSPARAASIVALRASKLV